MKLDMGVGGLEPKEFTVLVHELVRLAEAVDCDDKENHGVVGIPLRDRVLPFLEVRKHPLPRVLTNLGGGLQDLTSVAFQGGP